MLGRAIVYNAPFVFKGVWTIIKPWLDAATVERVMFVSDPAPILDLIDASVLHVKHGGTRKEEYNVLYYVPTEEMEKPTTQ